MDGGNRLVVIDNRLKFETVLSSVFDVVLAGEFVFVFSGDRNIRTVANPRAVGMCFVEVTSGRDGSTDVDAMVVRVEARTGAERGWYVSRLKLGILVKRIWRSYRSFG